MTPGKRQAMFIRNCWYVVAWDHELPADGLFGRTVIGEPLLLFGAPTAASSRSKTAAVIGSRRCRRGARRAIACAAATTD